MKITRPFVCSICKGPTAAAGTFCVALLPFDGRWKTPINTVDQLSEFNISTARRKR